MPRARPLSHGAVRRWTYARAGSPAQHYIVDYTGYRNVAACPMRRLQPPFNGIPIIVTFGPSIDIASGARPAQRRSYRSFLAGLHDVPDLSIEVADIEEALARCRNAKIAIEYGPGR